MLKLVRRCMLAVWCGMACANLHAGDPPIIATVTAPPVICFPGQRTETTVTLPAAHFARPFRVEAVTSDCSCVSTEEIPDGTIVAQRDLPLRIRIDASDVRAQAMFSVYVVGSIADEPAAMRVTMRARVDDVFVWPVNGLVWDMGAARLGEPRERTWTLHRGTHPAVVDRVEVAVVDGDPDALRVAVAPGADGSWETRVIWTPSRHLGVNMATLRWTAWSGGVQLPYQPERTLRMPVDGPVRAIPSLALLGGMRPGDERRASVDLAAASGALPVVERVEVADDADIRAVLGPEQDGRRELTLVCTAAAQPRRYDRCVLVHFADGMVLRIPYLGRVYP